MLAHGHAWYHSDGHAVHLMALERLIIAILIYLERGTLECVHLLITNRHLLRNEGPKRGYTTNMRSICSMAALT